MTARPDPLAAASSFRVGRRRIVATAAEALGRWAVQLGILPRAEGGTQRPPAERLAALIADPACTRPLAALDPDALLALRRRRLDALESRDAMLVEMAALAAAVTLLCELHALAWPNPLAAAAGDGVRLMDAESQARLRSRAAACGPATAARLELALASGARLSEMAAPALEAEDAGRVWLALPGRAVQVPALPGGMVVPAPACGLQAFLADQQVTEDSLRLTALAGRLDGGSHLDEAFLLAGCGLEAAAAPVRIPWFG